MGRTVGAYGRFFSVAAAAGVGAALKTTDPASQDIDVLRRLSDYHQVPILSLHAPCLLLTQRVWGREPWGKLVRAAGIRPE